MIPRGSIEVPNALSTVVEPRSLDQPGDDRRDAPVRARRWPCPRGKGTQGVAIGAGGVRVVGEV